MLLDQIKGMEVTLQELRSAEQEAKRVVVRARKKLDAFKETNAKDIAKETRHARHAEWLAKEPERAALRETKEWKDWYVQTFKERRDA